MYNRAILIGRLTADPELKQTTSGTYLVNFRIAVDRRFRGQDGERKADFLTIVAWRQSAEFVAKYFHKGQRVIISEGRIRVTPYTDRDGNKRTRFEVVADEVEFGESRRAPEDQEAGSVAAEYMTGGQFEELGEEDPGDLPF